MIESFALTGEPPGMNLFLLNLNTGQVRLFARFPAPQAGTADYLNGIGAFSPDSRALAYSFDTKGGTGVVFMTVATGHKIRSIFVPGGSPVPLFRWLPDGRLLVPGTNGLETVSKKGTGARPFNVKLGDYAQINTVVASPNGSEVAMEVDSGQGCSGGQAGPCNGAIYLAPMAGGTAIRLARSAESSTELVWSPDGRFLVYDGGGAVFDLMRVATRHTVAVRPPPGSGRVSIVGWRPGR